MEAGGGPSWGGADPGGLGAVTRFGSGGKCDEGRAGAACAGTDWSGGAATVALGRAGETCPATPLDPVLLVLGGGGTEPSAVGDS